MSSPKPDSVVMGLGGDRLLRGNFLWIDFWISDWTGRFTGTLNMVDAEIGFLLLVFNEDFEEVNLCRPVNHSHHPTLKYLQGGLEEWTYNLLCSFL